MTLPLARFALRLLGRARQSLARARVSARQPRTRMQPEAPAPRAAVPGDACGDAFDAARAFALLRAQCELGPRAPGTPGHALCREMLLGELACWTDAVATQGWTQTVARGAGAGAGYALTNVFARIDPAERDPSGSSGDPGIPGLMLCAHWDTRPVADQDPDPARRHLPVPGASDGASGVAVLLEIARALHVRRPPVPVLIGLFDGEDLGEYYYGSRIFARDVRRRGFAAWRPAEAVLLDMIGGRGVRCTTELHSRRLAPALWSRVQSAAAALGLAPRFAGPERAVSDDHLFLNRAGIPAIVLIDTEYPHWHTGADDVDACDAESLGVVGSAVLHLVRTMEPR